MNKQFKYMTLATAAKIANVNPSTLRYAIENERLLAVKVGKVWLTTREALAVWMNSDVHTPGRKAGK